MQAFKRLTVPFALFAFSGFLSSTPVASAPAVGTGGSLGTLSCFYGSSLPTVSVNQYSAVQCDVNGRLIVSPLSLIFGAPIQTYPSTGVGADTVFPTTVSTTGTSLGAIPSGASAIRIHLPPGSSVSFYVASSVATSSTAAALVSETRSNSSANTDTIDFSIELSNELVFVTNYTSGTSTTFISGKPVFRFI
jgi:hypothetical protein